MDTNYTKTFQAFRGISDYLISPCRGGLPLLLVYTFKTTIWHKIKKHF